MMNNLVKHRKAAHGSDLDCLFASRVHRDSFSAFRDDLARHSGLGFGVDDMASAYRLYLFLGELKNRR